MYNGVFDNELHSVIPTAGSNNMQSMTTIYAIFSTASPTSSPTSLPTSSPTSSPTSLPTSQDLTVANIFQQPLNSKVAKAKIKFYLGAFVAYFIIIYICLYLFAFTGYGKSTSLKLYDTSYGSQVHVVNCEVTPTNENSLSVVADLYRKNLSVQSMMKAEVRLKLVRESMRNNPSISSTKNDISLTRIYGINMSTNLLDSVFGSKNDDKYSKGYREYVQQQRTLLGCTPFLYPEGLTINIPCRNPIVLPRGRLESMLLYICHNHPLFSCFYFMDGSKLGAHGTRILYIGKDVAVFVLYQFSNTLLQYYMLDGHGLGIFINLFIITPSAVSVGLLLKYLYVCPFTETVEFQQKYGKYNSVVIFLGRLAIVPIMLVMSCGLIIACLFSSDRNILIILVNFFLCVQFYGVIIGIIKAILRFIDSYYYHMSILGAVDIVCIGSLYKERIMVEQQVVDVDYASRTYYYFGFIKLEIIMNRNDAIAAKWIKIQSEPIEMTSLSCSDGFIVENPLLPTQQEEKVSYMTLDLIRDVDNIDRKCVIEFQESPTLIIHDDNAFNKHLVNPVAPVESISNKIMQEDDNILYTEYQRNHITSTDSDYGFTEEMLNFEEWKLKKKEFKRGTRDSFVKAYQIFEEREQISGESDSSVANTVLLYQNVKKTTNVLLKSIRKK